jgi:hypothetical protein
MRAVAQGDPFGCAALRMTPGRTWLFRLSTENLSRPLSRGVEIAGRTGFARMKLSRQALNKHAPLQNFALIYALHRHPLHRPAMAKHLYLYWEGNFCF